MDYLGRNIPNIPPDIYEENSFQTTLGTEASSGQVPESLPMLSISMIHSLTVDFFKLFRRAVHW